MTILIHLPNDTKKNCDSGVFVYKRLPKFVFDFYGVYCFYINLILNVFKK